MLDKNQFAKRYDDLVDRLKPYVGTAMKNVPTSLKFSDPKERLLFLDEKERIATELITASWSQVLEYTLEESNNKSIPLRTCLLPYEIGEEWKEAWNTDISRTGLSQEQVETILKNFSNEISGQVYFPFGGYIDKCQERFELYR